jgi:hypothetical protein
MLDLGQIFSPEQNVGKLGKTVQNNQSVKNRILDVGA